MRSEEFCSAQAKRKPSKPKPEAAQRIMAMTAVMEMMERFGVKMGVKMQRSVRENWLAIVMALSLSAGMTWIPELCAAEADLVWSESEAPVTLGALSQEEFEAVA